MSARLLPEGLSRAASPLAGDEAWNKVEVAGTTVTTVLVTAVVVTAVVACFFTLGMPGLIAIAAMGGAAVFTASGTAIYSCIPQHVSNTSETVPKRETAIVTPQQKTLEDQHAKKLRIEAEWEVFARKDGNADQFIGRMVDLIEGAYRNKADKQQPDSIYRQTTSVEAVLNFQSQIAHLPDVSSGIRLISESFSENGDIIMLTNLLKKFIETLRPEDARSISDETLRKLDDHLLGLCAFGEPPVKPVNLFRGWGALVVFDYKKSAFLGKVPVKDLISMNNTRSLMSRPTGWDNAYFEQPPHPHVE